MTIAIVSLKDIPDDRICDVIDQGIRHKAGATPDDYLKSFLRISRDLGYATQDDSWSEFEKEFAIIVMRMVQAERHVARLKHVLEVPAVWSQEERDGMAEAFADAYGKHGHHETIFAVSAWLLRHRAKIAGVG